MRQSLIIAPSGASASNWLRWIASIIFCTSCSDLPVTDDGNSTTSVDSSGTWNAGLDLPIEDLPIEHPEIICTYGEIGPVCVARMDGDTWVTHLTRECDPIFDGLTRTELDGWLPGWYAQQPVPAINLQPTATWPNVGFCQAGWPINLGSLENPRCGTACDTCIMRCAADYNGVAVMITPTCMLSLYELTPSDLSSCP